MSIEFDPDIQDVQTIDKYELLLTLLHRLHKMEKCQDTYLTIVDLLSMFWFQYLRLPLLRKIEDEISGKIIYSQLSQAQHCWQLEQGQDLHWQAPAGQEQGPPDLHPSQHLHASFSQQSLEQQPAIVVVVVFCLELDLPATLSAPII